MEKIPYQPLRWEKFSQLLESYGVKESDRIAKSIVLDHEILILKRVYDEKSGTDSTKR